MTRPVVFSASSVNAYLSCHLQWYFGYVLNEQGEQSEAQAVGIAVHDYAEGRLRERNDTPMTPRRPIPVEHVAAVSPLLLVFDHLVLPTYGEPLLIEQPFQIEINGIPYSGIIDSLDRHEASAEIIGEPLPRVWATYILRDLKTTGSRPSAGRYRFAMTGYYLGVTEGLSLPVHAMRLDYLVRTKTPYYWPEDVNVPDEDDLAWFAATLQTVADGVEQGDYQPTGLGTRACSSCPYKSICGPYQRYQKITSPLRQEVNDA